MPVLQKSMDLFTVRFVLVVFQATFLLPGNGGNHAWGCDQVETGNKSIMEK